MMMFKSKKIILATAILFSGVLFSCEKPAVEKKTAIPAVVSMKIQQPSQKQVKPKTEKQIKKASVNAKQAQQQESLKPALKKESALQEAMADHYDAGGKTDPFLPLIRERSGSPEPKPGAPKRILTPLEKVELSQIRLVAVIGMKGKRIAMVEEASGKGYEIGVGTYIGKRQGRVAQITDNSILIKEPVRDFMGRLSENIQEIKLHKNDGEE